VRKQKRNDPMLGEETSRRIGSRERKSAQHSPCRKKGDFLYSLREWAGEKKSGGERESNEQLAEYRLAKILPPVRKGSIGESEKMAA